MKNYLKLFILGILLISCVCILTFQNKSSKVASTTFTQPSLFNSWQTDEPLQLTIETDLESLLNNKNTEHLQTATISWSTDGSTTQSLAANISPRGKTRLNICDFPPLKLKFDPTELEASGLAPYKSLKLVTHCNDDQQLVLKEYLTYKMYNQLTENSFQVQLVEVTYQDSKGQQEPITQYAIALENNKEMANRLGGSQMKTNEDNLRSIDADQYRLLTVFQYMVGNTDWNLSKSHNIKLIQTQNGKSAPIPVPYDFDYAGIVDAPYAQPHPQLPIQTVTQRLFQWRGKNAVGFETTLALFQNNKKALFELCQNLSALDESQKTEMMNYLASFYEIIDRVDDGADLMVAFQKMDSPLASYVVVKK